MLGAVQTTNDGQNCGGDRFACVFSEDRSERLFLQFVLSDETYVSN